MIPRPTPRERALGALELPGRFYFLAGKLRLDLSGVRGDSMELNLEDLLLTADLIHDALATLVVAERE